VLLLRIPQDGAWAALLAGVPVVHAKGSSYTVLNPLESVAEVVTVQAIGRGHAGQHDAVGGEWIATWCGEADEALEPA
jgi:hypothetical protein